MTMHYSNTLNLQDRLTNLLNIDLFSLFYDASLKISSGLIFRDKNGLAVCHYSWKMNKWQIANNGELNIPNAIATDPVESDVIFQMQTITE